MELRDDTLPSRAYRIATDVLGAFTGRDHHGARPNICLLVRRVCVYLPLIFALHVGFVGWLGFLFLYYPITNFGQGYGIFWLVIAGIAAIIAAGIFLVKMSGKAAYLLGNAVARLSHRPAALVARHWLHDLHERICTPIRFTHGSKP